MVCQKSDIFTDQTIVWFVHTIVWFAKIKSIFIYQTIVWFTKKK